MDALTLVAARFRADRDTFAILFAACRLAHQHGLRSLSPELLLLTSLHDRRVRSWWGADADEAVRALWADLPARDADGRAKDGWTRDALAAAGAATARAARRGPSLGADDDVHAKSRWVVDRLWGIGRGLIRSVGGQVIDARGLLARGDLLHGLGTTHGLAGRLLAGRPTALFGGLDAEDAAVPEGDAFDMAPPPGSPPGSVVIDDDPQSTMPAVVALLRGGLGFGEEQAILAMSRVHHRGADRVLTLPWERAAFAVETCRRLALTSAPKLRIRLVPR